jgi:hypothetical protein
MQSWFRVFGTQRYAHTYRIISRAASRGEDAILIMLWRQNEGGTDNFSRQDAPLHSLPAAISPHISTVILIAWYQLTFDAMASLCKMTVPYPGYRLVEEVYKN